MPTLTKTLTESAQVLAQRNIGVLFSAIDPIRVRRRDVADRTSRPPVIRPPFTGMAARKRRREVFRDVRIGSARDDDRGQLNVFLRDSK